MRVPGTFAAAILFAIGPVGVEAAEGPAAIVDRAITAHGGAEKLAKFKAEQWKAKGSIHTFGMDLPYSGHFYFEAPDHFRFDAAVEFGGQKMEYSAGTDGKAIWEKAADKIEDMPKKKAEYFQHNLYVLNLTRLLPLRSKEITLTPAEPTTIEDRAAVGFAVSQKGRPNVSMWFDKETGRLVKTQTQVWDEFTDKDVSQEVLMSDYTSKDGLLLAGKLTIKRDGKPFLDEKLSERQSSEQLDAKLFVKP